MPPSPLPESWDLPSAITNRIGRRAGRQRSMVADGHVLLLLRDVPKEDNLQGESCLFWYSPNGEWTSRSRGKGFKALNALLDDYDAAVDALDVNLDKNGNASHLLGILRQLSPLKRLCDGLYLALQEARDQVRGKDLAVEKDLITARDRAEEILKEAELLFEDTRHTLDILVAMKAEEQAETAVRLDAASYRLNILAAVFLPLVALSGIFGMNLKSGLPQNQVVLFWIVLGMGIIMGLTLIFVVRRWK